MSGGAVEVPPERGGIGEEERGGHQRTGGQTEREPRAGQHGAGQRQEHAHAEDHAHAAHGADRAEGEQAHGQAPGHAAGDVGRLQQADLAAAGAHVVVHRALQHRERDAHEEGGQRVEKAGQDEVQAREGRAVDVPAEAELAVAPVVDVPGMVRPDPEAQEHQREGRGHEQDGLQ
jgi:hypothetical protein